jgi:hypothetical protein
MGRKSWPYILGYAKVEFHAMVGAGFGDDLILIVQLSEFGELQGTTAHITLAVGS